MDFSDVGDVTPKPVDTTGALAGDTYALAEMVSGWKYLSDEGLHIR